MKLSEQVRSISYLKSHAAEVMQRLREQGEPLVITQNGEATAVIQGIEDYEQTQETLALLKILALGNIQIAEERTTRASASFARLRRRVLGEESEE